MKRRWIAFGKGIGYIGLYVGMQTLVTTQYIGSNGIIAFCKDYYNTEVMRFRFALRK